MLEVKLKLLYVCISADRNMKSSSPQSRREAILMGPINGIIIGLLLA